MERRNLVRGAVVGVLVGTLVCVGLLLYLGEIGVLLDIAEVIGALLELL